jgi:hypothetical protein
MVGRVRLIEKYILIGFVVPKLGPHDQQWKGLVLERRGFLGDRLARIAGAA